MRRSRGRLHSLIVFARRPVPGRTKTRLIPLLGARGAAELAEAFVQDALAKVAAFPGWRPMLAVAGSDRRRDRDWAQSFRLEFSFQARGDLGSRMKRALDDSGAAIAAVLGTDTPAIPRRLIRQNLKLLQRNDVVLGPALDGGYYFVGVRHPVPDIFRKIDWGGPKVLAQTMAKLKRLKIPFALGPWWYDVDVPADLALLVDHLQRRPALRSACPATVRCLLRNGLMDN